MGIFMIIKTLKEIAKNEAIKSTYIYKVGAVIWRGKEIISTGHNYRSKSVRSINKNYVKWYPAIHAEVDAIINAKKDLTKASILVIRVTKSGKLSMAKPCRYCTAYINHVGLKTVYFSNREGNIEEKT